MQYDRQESEGGRELGGFSPYLYAEKFVRG